VLFGGCVAPEALDCGLAYRRWYLTADVYVLEAGGNVLDAAALAVAAALKDTLLPSILTANKTTGQVSEGEAPRHPLRLALPPPVVVSMAHIEGALLLDPTSEEEALAHGLLTIALSPLPDDSGDQGTRLLEQRGRPLPPAMLEQALLLAKARAIALRQTLHTAAAS